MTQSPRRRPARQKTPDGIRQPKRRAFLGAFAQTGNVTRAAEMAGVDRSMHYLWLSDALYAAAFERAKDEAADHLETEARRRAVEGLRRLKFNRNGEPLKDPETGQPYVEHEYSDTLLIFLLKGARPETYKDRAELTGKDGKPLEVAVTWDAALTQAWERRGSKKGAE